MFIDICGDIFFDYFTNALALKSAETPEQQSSRDYLAGIAAQSAGTPKPDKIVKLFDFLNEMDRRRSTNWAETFPWLINEFKKYDLTADQN
jgi:hypothetical protein